METVAAGLLWRCCGLTYTGSAAERVLLAYALIAAAAALLLLIYVRGR